MCSSDLPTVVSPNVYIAGGTKGAPGSIIRSKGRGKFEMADSTSLSPSAMTGGNAYAVITTGNTNWSKFNNYGTVTAGDIWTVIQTSASDVSTGTVNLVGVCTLTNAPAASLSTGQASLPYNLNAFTANVGNTNTGSATTTWINVIWANGNVAGVSNPTVGSVFANAALGISGTATVTSIASYGTNGSNANVALSITQTVANVASATVSTYVFAARLSNKFVTDFSGNKYKWTFNAPTATTVQLQGN